MGTAVRRIVRRLAATPGFTATVVLTLALGIAANVAVFSVVSGVLLEPLPYERPEELVAVWHTAPGLGFEQINQCAALDFVYRRESTAFASTALWDSGRAAVTGDGEPEEVETLGVNEPFLPLLGVDAALGRRFGEEDDRPGAEPTAMLTHSYWQRRFGGRREVVGETLLVNGRSRTIVGVLPEDFTFQRQRPDVLLPLQIDESRVFVGMFNYQGIARLRPDVTLEQANAEIDRLLPVTIETYPGGLTLKMLEEAGFSAALEPLRDELVGDISQALWVLLVSVGVVLLVACANVANLYLVRAEGRHRELALRTALGAGRGRLVRELLGESLLLGLLGGAVGAGLAWGLVRLLVWVAPQSLPRLESIQMSPAVLLFALVVSVLSGLLFGVLPAVRHTGGGNQDRLSESLKDGGRGASAGRERFRLRGGLVVAQVALGLMLLVGSGLMLRSFLALRDVEPGFRDAEELLVFGLSVPSAEVEDPTEVMLLQKRVLERLEGLAGVQSVGATSSLTMSSMTSNDALMVEDFPTEEGSLPPIRRYKFITPGYHETMGNPVLVGRSLEWADLHEKRPVAVITADLAEELWGSPRAALGKRVADGVPELEAGPPLWREIVGVVGSIHDDGPSKGTVPTVYWPAFMPRFWGTDDWVQRSLAFVVRSERTGTAALLREVQQAVWQENAKLPLANPQSMRDIERRALARASFTMLMLALAAAMALLIGAVGIYGVISYIVSQRIKEIGVRIALGAAARDVHGMMVRYGMLLSGLGIGVGLVASVLVAGLLSRLLFGVEPRDPLTFATVAAILIVVALTSSLLAGLRAARVDPMEALRAE